MNSESFQLIIVDQSGLQSLTLIPTPKKYIHGFSSYGYGQFAAFRARDGVMAKDVRGVEL